MITKGSSRIGSVRYGSLIISTIFNGIKKVYNKVASAFGAGYWINTEGWNNNDGWKNG